MFTRASATRIKARVSGLPMVSAGFFSSKLAPYENLLSKTVTMTSYRTSVEENCLEPISLKLLGFDLKDLSLKGFRFLIWLH